MNACATVDTENCKQFFSRFSHYNANLLVGASVVGAETKNVRLVLYLLAAECLSAPVWHLRRMQQQLHRSFVDHPSYFHLGRDDLRRCTGSAETHAARQPARGAVDLILAFYA